VPRLSYFHGITIKMYWREGHHRLAHFHAYYGEHEASLNVAGEIIVGSLPKHALRLVQDWADLHAAEIEANWQLVLSKKPLDPIDPLR
jgi:Domain of unknown function (DUF4160)